MLRSFVIAATFATALIGLKFALPAAAATATPTVVFTVPGVIQLTPLSTYFTCTALNVAQTIQVELFNDLGTLVANGNVSAAANQTVTFGTRGYTGGFLEAPDGGAVNLFPPDGMSGWAEIISTSKSLICAAYVRDSVTLNPSFMDSRPVISKERQRGD
jgi:hypothetical protein